MSNPLLVFWQQLFGRDERRRAQRDAPARRRRPRGAQASATIFLIMRRMRAPLIMLIVIFARQRARADPHPGQDAARPAVADGLLRRVLLHELHRDDDRLRRAPDAFTAPQRLWVTARIYLTVIGWAYAIGSMLTLLQDRAFRQALALHTVHPEGRRGCGEPFLLIAGYGRTGELLGQGVRRAGPAVRGDRRRRGPDRRAGTGRPTTPTCPVWSATPATRPHLGVAGSGPPVLRRRCWR